MSDVLETEPCPTCGTPYRMACEVGEGHVYTCPTCGHLEVDGDDGDGSALQVCPWCQYHGMGYRKGCPICSGVGAVTRHDMMDYWLRAKWSPHEVTRVCGWCRTVYQKGLPWAPESTGACAVCAGKAAGEP